MSKMGHSLGRVQIALLLVLLLAVVLVGQSVADASMPVSQVSGTGVVLGRASFAYLTGVRVFIAQVLWNRIDPILHEYYSGVPLHKQTYMLTTFNVITLLDPQFEQPYYIGPWILAREGHVDAALELSAKGAANVPDSGLLRTSYAQMLFLYGSDLDEAVKQANVATSGSIRWLDAIEQHDSYGILRAVYMKAGMTDQAAEVLRVIERLDAEIGDQLPAEGHDHNGDGKPDH
ncbi:MAG: hypothetical protein KJ747_11485 [Actinobacteria bacterium]|nr:hypothetical protein [Actinomycetota bacterium]